MKAIVVKDCKVAPNGHTTEALKKDQEIDGDLAKFAVSVGLAKVAKEPAVKKSAPKKTTAKKKTTKKK